MVYVKYFYGMVCSIGYKVVVFVLSWNFLVTELLPLTTVKEKKMRMSLHNDINTHTGITW